MITDRIAGSTGNKSFMFLLPISLMVVYWTTMAVTGYRGIRVRFRRGSLRNSYHFYGGQQARKLPNDKKIVEAAKRNRPSEYHTVFGSYNGGYLKPSNIEYQLEDKSGASTRGNSSSKSLHLHCCS